MRQSVQSTAPRTMNSFRFCFLKKPTITDATPTTSSTLVTKSNNKMLMPPNMQWSLSVVCEDE